MTKKCKDCNETKDISEFRPRGKGRIGTLARCNPCEKLRKNKYYQDTIEKESRVRREYRRKHSERLNEGKRRRRKENPEKYLAKDREYASKNREHINKQQAGYYAKNKEELLEKNKEYRGKNKHAIRETYRRRYLQDREAYIMRARRRQSHISENATPKWANMEKIKQIYFLAKELSEKHRIEYHVDHIIPLKGKNVSGFHVENNLQILTAEENRKKSNLY